MTLFPPGSTLWMIRHDVRLSWRRFSAERKSKIGLIVTLLVLVLPIVGFGIFGGYSLRYVPDDLFAHARDPRIAQVSNLVYLMLDGVVAFLFSIMLAQAIGAATIVFYDRGDLDLLLSSPTPPQKVLAVRMLAIAFNCCWGFILLAAPFLISAGTLGGHPAWMAGLAMMAALALLATALGVSLAMVLFRLIGPRRTRTVAQILGALIGLTVFLTTQIPNMMGHERVEDVIEHRFSGLPIQSVDGWLLWLAKAVLGEPGPFFAVLGGAIALFTAVTWVLGLRFADNAAAAAGAAEQTFKAKTGSGQVNFRTGWVRVLLGKELKLVFRDPALLSQVLLQSLYLIPASYAIISSSTGGHNVRAIATGAGGAAVLTFAAGQLASGFGWLTMSAEEAPELLLCAPITQQQAGNAKVLAVLIPTLSVMAIPLAILAWFSPWSAACGLLGVTACGTAVGYMELWTQKPGKRADFRMRRRGTGSGWTFFLEFAVGAMIATAVALLAAGGLFAAAIPAPLGVAGLILAAIKKDKWLNA